MAMVKHLPSGKPGVIVGTDTINGTERLRLWTWDRDGCGEIITNVLHAQVETAVYEPPEPEGGGV